MHAALRLKSAEGFSCLSACMVWEGRRNFAPQLLKGAGALSRWRLLCKSNKVHAYCMSHMAALPSMNDTSTCLGGAWYCASPRT